MAFTSKHNNKKYNTHSRAHAKFKTGSNFETTVPEINFCFENPTPPLNGNLKKREHAIMTSNEDSETLAKRARLESKIFRKRFSLRTVGKPHNREKNDQSLTTHAAAVTQPNGSSENKEKVHGELDDVTLERLATDELLKEAARAKARADVGGPIEWTRKPARLNRRFVTNSILQTESQNRRASEKKSSKKKDTS